MKYIDSNIFLYALMGNSEAVEVLRNIASGRMRACTSSLTWDEFVWVCRKEIGKEDMIKESKRFLQFPNLQFLSVSIDTVSTAHNLMESGLKPRDAIHIASMKMAGISEIISEDSDFDKVKGIKRICL